MIVDALGPQGFGVYEVDLHAPGMPMERVSKPPHGLLIPGFVDIHIHGAFDIDFMDASKTDMEILCKKLHADGYEGFLPTTITAPCSDILNALDNLPDDPLIWGFHLEGPFISPVFPGAQPPQHIAEPPQGPSEWDAVLNDTRLKVITLAPEMPGALELIRRLDDRGVVVSMGHTDATYDATRFGFEFGARHTTHTFNAMRGFHHREAGTVGYALTQEALRCELIYDRIHVCKESARVLIRNKPSDGIVAVSDSSRATGLPPGTEVVMWGHRCEVGKKQVRLADSGSLAGSAVTLYDCFKNLHDDFGAEVAIRACCLNPRLALGVSKPPRTYLLLDEKLDIVSRYEHQV
ncbi:MAG: amidohydrolase family protein [Armatimonadetes bacterium]|nr:amidohydrolase family protein [Armatimonadota bacterium]